ncbi:MAG TPA: sugar ABC transporter ATP-binding protein, partial [Solirubrobacterales bacterium]|nr:sugar ABC transporter ATP-binding protein [Solirubrobacterales bacterium]
ILAGVYRGDPGGEIVVHGRAVDSDGMTPALSRELGLRFVHQDQGTFGELTVAENIALVNGWSAAAGRVRWRLLNKRAQQLLDRFEIAARPEQPMGTLPQSSQTMVAIARALEDLDSELSLLVLDEPTASLPQQEVEVLLDAVRACARREQTIIYVSHRIDEVLAIADAVTVLRDGREEVTRSTAGLSEDQLVEHIVGRPIETVLLAPPAAARAEPVLEVDGLRGGPLKDVTFKANRGEILGVAGLRGSGRTELIRTIFGADRKEGGTIAIEGKKTEIGSVSAAIAEGIACVPENRGLDAAFLDLDVRENVSAAGVGEYWNGVFFAHRRERSDVREDIARFSVRTPSEKTTFASLSGGNQQKVILARWLRLRPRLLLLDEPTQGVDIGARAEVYAAIDEAVREGLTVLLVSSDFEELAHVSDRVLVLRDGEIVGELEGSMEGDRITESVYRAKESTQ